MLIYEFIDKYCRDLVEKYKTSKALIMLDDLPHDDTIEDDEGRLIPVVDVDGLKIPVSDFITMDKADFLRTWSGENVAEQFDNYMSALTILEGEDALNRIRNAIVSETNRLKRDVELVTAI